jgi:integrase
LALIAAQPHVQDSPYVFPGRTPTRPLREIRRLWYAVRHAANLPDVRLHDLRHSVASFAGGHGYSLFLIGKLLGHKTAQSTERYAHVAEDARKIMADRVSETIRQALDAVGVQPVPLKAVK